VLVEAGAAPRAALLCALLSERLPPRPGPGQATDCDAFPLLDEPRRLPPRVRDAAAQLARQAAEALAVEAGPGDDETLRRALLAGFPDRVALRREPGSPRLLLASGHGARLAAASGVHGGEALVGLDVALGRRGPGSEALVRLACRVEREWLEPDRTERSCSLDAGSGAVRGVEREMLGALVLRERPAEPDPAEAERLLVGELERRGPSAADETLLRRCRLAGVGVDLGAARRAACAGRRRLPDFALHEWIEPRDGRRLAELAPERLRVPSGREHRLEYREDGRVVLRVKLQEMFGLAETPRVGPRGEPVLLELLSPAGRPVQVTDDLRSFWEGGYRAVRAELRGRYPRHPWPEDPWSAPPTARTKARR
jgi:ATP-dependent helicase HrpB